METEAYTIRQAAEICGKTYKVIAHRVERGKIDSEKRDGVRYITRVELERHGLWPGAETPRRQAITTHGVPPLGEVAAIQLSEEASPPAGEGILDADEEQQRLTMELRHLEDACELGRKERSRLGDEIDGFTKERDQTAVDLERARNEWKNAQGEQARLSREVEDLGGEHHRLSEEIDGLRGEHWRLSEEIQGLRGEVERERSMSAASELQGEQDQLQQKCGALNDEIAQLREEQTQRQEAALSAQADAKRLVHEASEAREERSHLREEIAELRVARDEARISGESMGLLDQHREGRDDAERLMAQVEGLGAECSRLHAQAEKLKLAQELAASTLQETQAQCDQSRVSHQQLQRQEQQVVSHLEQLRNERAALSDLPRSPLGLQISESVKGIRREIASRREARSRERR